MKRLFLLLALAMLSGALLAQTVTDALRYSMQTYNGTARSTAMGGAFGALGGDFSSISINPAGIGVYRSSEFTFTPSIELSRATNSNISQEEYSFTIGNIGFVTTFKPRIEEDGWKSFNLGFGYNRVNNFRRDAFLQVLSSNTSLLDVFATNASGTPPDNLNIFSEGLAYETFLLDTITGTPNQYITPLVEGDLVNQRKHITEKGHMGEYVLSFGANYNNRLYLGAMLGIQSIYYKATSSYTESTLATSESDLDQYTFEEYVKTIGAGYNFKFGAIYKATENLRLGAAIHTPTFYSMTDDFENRLTSHFLTPDSEGNMSYQDSSPFEEYDYDLETPLRFIVSAAYLFNKKALISVDYEFIDYSNAKLSDGQDGYNFFGTADEPGPNDEIQSAYQSTGNLRIGGEYRVNSYFSLRGGFAHFGSPYKSGLLNSNSEYNTYSLGLGLKRDNFFFDAAYVYSDKEEKFSFYSEEYGDEGDKFFIESEPSTLENKNHQLRMTFGFKF